MKRSRSLFFRLLLTFFLLGTGIILSFILSFRFLGNQNFKKNITNNYENYTNYIIADLGQPITYENLKRVEEKLSVGIIVNEMKSSASLPNLNEIQKIHQITNNLFLGSRKNERFLLRKKNNDYFAFAVNMATSEEFPFEAIISALLISGLLFLLCYFYIRRMFRPLDLIKEGATHYAKGDFSFPIPENEKGQLGELSESIASMGNEIQRMLDSKRELLLAIAHELRTPLTRAKLHTELLNDPRKVEISKNIDEMSNLVDDLLEGERLNSGHQALNKSKESLKELITEIVYKYFQNKEIELKLQSISSEVDKKLYSLALKNILANAFAHGRGVVTVTLDTDAITVSNRAEYIKDDIINNIFEPFYRGEPSRKRNEAGEGVGLGLYLVSQIIKAHNHSISAKSDDETFTITILLNLEVTTSK